MKSLRRHMTFANVASLMALIFSMSGGALAARHYLIHSTNQISPKVLKKLKGEPGEIGPIGPQGPTGLAGPRGPNGGRGEPAPTVLPTGVSETGDFAVHGQEEEGGALAVGLTFRIPLPAILPVEHVILVRASAPTLPPECPGVGLAAKGYLCVYSTRIAGVGTPVASNPEGTATVSGAGRFGFTLEVPVTGKPSVYEGSYTVTGA
jgi:hypothetical protein